MNWYGLNQHISVKGVSYIDFSYIEYFSIVIVERGNIIRFVQGSRRKECMMVNNRLVPIT